MSMWEKVIKEENELYVRCSMGIEYFFVKEIKGIKDAQGKSLQFILGRYGDIVIDDNYATMFDLIELNKYFLFNGILGRYLIFKANYNSCLVYEEM